ncbi:unnamed protein product [Spirodela intermedia]|uniref:Uncharacterized protein n=1 Tax=Spirodela intermedia TaxID=51605 RepID=A0A7I8KNP2_SPIIN|nr:unnamed protein product [Spirodela intermedia]
MPSISCANLLELVSQTAVDFASPTRPLNPRLSRAVTVPGIISDSGGIGGATGHSSDDPVPPFVAGACDSPFPLERRIIVTNQLPVLAHRDSFTRRWRFSWDTDALSLQLRAGFPAGTEVIHIGTLRPPPPRPSTGGDPIVEAADQEEIAHHLYEKFRCVPVFLSDDLHHRFYHGFCKRYLWPLFHHSQPISTTAGAARFDRALWQAYVSANKAFSDKVTEVLDPDEDYVWVHDYHLLVLPTFLRRRFHRVKLGFFLHSPFPSSEIYRTLPVREEILKALLNSDMVGFHTFDYARHFLSCCSRMLGIDHRSKRGFIGLEYYGRIVGIKILPVGVDIGQLETVMRSPAASEKTRQLMQQFHGRTVLLGIDDVDLFKGISLKFLAMGQLLEDHPEWRGRAVLVQIANPARSGGKEVQELLDEMVAIANEINRRFAVPGYDPIVLIHRRLPPHERVAFYAIAECCVVNAVRDGMNLVPYEYTVCRQGSPAAAAEGCPRRSIIVVSEFIGCSPSLSAAIRVNPWNVDAVAEALSVALKTPAAEKQLRHEKHFRYVSSHDVAFWAGSFDRDLQRACRHHFLKRVWGIGFGLGFRVVALGPSFRKLSVEHIVSVYRKTTSRLLLLDYDGTILPQASASKAPGEEVISLLSSLCSDPKNVVFLVSGRGRHSLSDWFGTVENLGISAEHGFFMRHLSIYFLGIKQCGIDCRWGRDTQWETCSPAVDFRWMEMVEPVMRVYAETTDGSWIERKESALVWHHHDANPDFGSRQAKELLDHLESVLVNEAVVVKRGHHIVEVKPQGVSKGKVVEGLVAAIATGGKPVDFIFCVGDDRSDEDMFESIAGAVKVRRLATAEATEVFACTVGQKPSRARYYLDDPAEVIRTLQGLVSASTRPPNPATAIQVSFES